MMRELAPKLGQISEGGKARMVVAHQEAARVPKYIRAAVKALGKTLQEHGGDIVDGEVIHEKRLPEQRLLAKQRGRKGA